MNKGLEVIEAAYLFAMPPERIEVLIHPQSDHPQPGRIRRRLDAGAAGPARHAPADRLRLRLARPAAVAGAASWTWPKSGPLTFEEPDPKRFPALAIAKQALNAGGRAPAAMNAANEVAVAAFLDRRIGFLDIAARGGGDPRAHGSPGPHPSARTTTSWRRAQATDATARRVADEVVSGLMARA